MSRFPALIFDLDGLLIDTETLYFEATRRLIRPYGYDVTVEEYADWVGRHGDFSLADRVVGNLLEITPQWLEG